MPQRTKLGPWVFAVMINALGVKIRTCGNMWTTQRSQLHEDKCKELRIFFARTERSFTPISVHNKPTEVVSNTKVLGLHISQDLKWNNHIAEIVKKVSN